MKLLGSIAVVFSIFQISGFAQECVAAASNVQEMQNKFDVVFDGINEEVEEWATNFADSVGRNKNTIKTYLADQQNLLVGFGMTREEGAKLSEEMTTLALDLASFANLDETMAVNNMTKAVMGESEAAKSLGAVLNDVTRAETMAAMGISGKYDKLDQLTKMQVNYNAILRQSPDAVGDCIRSMDSYEAAQRRQNAATMEFKETIGNQLIPIFTTLTNWQTKGIKAATSFAKAILGDTEESNHLLHAFERIHALVKRLQPSMDRLSQSFQKGISGASSGLTLILPLVEGIAGIAVNGIARAIDMIVSVADKLGGIQNLLRILTAVAAAFFLVTNWGRIVEGARKVWSTLRGIFNFFGGINLKTVALVAAVALLILAVEDFVNFMAGNDSLIGVMFERAGIDAEAMRQKIVNIWENLKTFFAGVWDAIKGILAPVLDFIKSAIEKVFGPDIFAGLGEGIAGVIEFLERLTGAIANNKGLQQLIAGAVVKIGALMTAAKVVIPIIGTLGSVLGGILNKFGGAPAVIDGAQGSVSVFSEVLQSTLGGMATFLGGAAMAVTNFVSMFQNGFSVVKEILMVVGIAIAAVGAVILGAPATVAAVVAGIIASVGTLAVIIKEHWEAIKGFFGGIGEGIKSVGDKIASFLHLKPDNGEKKEARNPSESGERFSAALDKAGYSMEEMQSRFEALGVSAENFYDILDYADGNADTFADALYEACNAGASFEDVERALGVGLEELGQIMDTASVFSAEKFPSALAEAGYSMEEMRSHFEALGVSAGDFYDILNYANGDADTFADALYEACNAGTSFEDVERALGVSLEELGQIMDTMSMSSTERLSSALTESGYSMEEMQSHFEALGISAENFYDILDYADGNADTFADALYEACDAGTSFEEVERALGVGLEELGQIMSSTVPDPEPLNEYASQVQEQTDLISADMQQMSDDTSVPFPMLPRK